MNTEQPNPPVDPAQASTTPLPEAPEQAEKQAANQAANQNANQAETRAADPAPAPPVADPRRNRPRTGPIVWGALMLVFCAYIAQQTLAPGSVDALSWAIASVIGLGVLLLLVGLAVILRSSRGPGR